MPMLEQIAIGLAVAVIPMVLMMGWKAKKTAERKVSEMAERQRVIERRLARHKRCMSELAASMDKFIREMHPSQKDVVGLEQIVRMLDNGKE